MNIQQLFELGMKREVPQLLDFPEGLVLNLGAGKHVLPGALNLDYPQWDAENYHIEVTDRIRHQHRAPNRAYPLPPEAGDMYVTCPDGIVAGIHAYHFLEHVRDPRRMLREMQRVLMPGGVINIVVPHHFGQISFQDLDHKHHFALEVWRTTLDNHYYDKGNTGWELEVHFNMMMAIVERNTCIFTQLVKR